MRGGLSAVVASAVAAAALALGCAPPDMVDRAYGHAVVRGRYVSPEAYAAFLRGAIAEADGHAPAAVAAYGEAAGLDPASPEIWTRIAELGCRDRAQAQDALAELDRAVRLDPTYAPAWAAESHCLASLGRPAEAAHAAARASALDPRADGANALLGRLGRSADPGPGEREALLADTRAASDPVAAWEALVNWARGHGDVVTWATALRELVRVAPQRRAAVARSAEELAGLGELGPARSVAAAALDASESPLTLGLAARLGLDEAIARADRDDVRRRATRGRLGLGEAAARAWLAGNARLATTLAVEASEGDPSARGARLVLTLCTGGDLVGAASAARHGDAPVSAAAFVAFGIALARVVPPAAARAALATIAHQPLASGDDRTVRPAVDLVSRGVLPADELSPDGAVELAAVGGGASPTGDGSVDPRHEYLALALTHPDAPRTRELGAQLAALGGHDPIIACAAALVHLATGDVVPADAPRVLLARNPADPLIAATALRLAEKAGDVDVARQARETLGALGRRRSGLE